MADSTFNRQEYIAKKSKEIVENFMDRLENKTTNGITLAKEL